MLRETPMHPLLKRTRRAFKSQAVNVAIALLSATVLASPAISKVEN